MGTIFYVPLVEPGVQVHSLSLELRDMGFISGLVVLDDTITRL